METRTPRAALRGEPVRGFAKILRDHELEALRLAHAWAQIRIRTALELGLCCGLRSQEIAGLRWGDVDLPGRRLYVPPSIAKGGRGRTCYLLEAMAILLRDYRRTAFRYTTARTPLFPSRKGGEPVTPGQIRRMISEAFVRAGIARPGLSSHALRHTFAVHVYRESRDLELVRRLLGHRRLRTTMIYLEGLGELVGYRSEEIEKQLARMNALLGESLSEHQ